MKRFFVWAAGLAVLLAIGSLAWVRLAPSDPAGWHVDPLTGPERGAANSWLVAPEGGAGVDAVAPVYPVPAEDLAQALDAVAREEPSTERVAGRPQDLWTTYLQRSRWIGFPDYVSVRAVPLNGDRSTLAIFSRSRFGSDDLGVNRARVERWLAALAPLQE